MTLEQIGQKLKSARDGSGLSLSQIQEKTKIPFSHLAAIDAGNFDDLPEPVYVSGFIKRYADCVGLDSQTLVDEYRNELDSLTAQPVKSGFLFKNNRNNGNHTAPTAYYNRQSVDHTPPNLIKVIPFYALWIVLILGLIVYLVNRQGAIDLSQQDSALLTLRQSTALNVPKGVNGVPPSTSENTQTTDNTSTRQVNASDNSDSPVTIRAKNHVWVEVKAVSNGESLFNGFLEAGDTRDFTDKEGIRIRSGNGGNVMVTASGKTSELGAAGKISEKTFASKVNQVAQNKSEPNNDQLVDTKTNSSPAQSSSHKKPADQVITPTKKPTIVSTPKPHPITESTSPRAKNNPDGPDSNANKAIDVPYRYSE